MHLYRQRGLYMKRKNRSSLDKKIRGRSIRGRNMDQSKRKVQYEKMGETLENLQQEEESHRHIGFGGSAPDGGGRYGFLF